MKTISHRFVRTIPDQLENEVLYVSVEYSTAVHKCFCGCGQEVVTPLSPVGWKLTFDGETVSLYPSIGNWSFKCSSHYWITKNEVLWAAKWTQEEIRLGRQLDTQARDGYFNESILSKLERKNKNDFIHRNKWEKLVNRLGEVTKKVKLKKGKKS